MARTAFQFPGQGSQYVGMGRSFHDASAFARELFARANDVLGFDLTSLCFAGPEAELRRTENAQPALFAVNAVAAALLRERGIEPVAVAGHSVGEYAALVAADAFTFDDALRAVRRRGELMAGIGQRAPGTMAAIVGLPIEIVEELCATASAHGVIDIANENGPTQTVVSGEIAAVEQVMDLVDARQEGMAIPLAVSGAFHSRLMAPVAAEMADVLSSIPIRPARVPVVANVTGDIVGTPEAIRTVLVDQIAGRVKWGASVRRLAVGADRLIEAGPGRTLTRLARELAPGLTLQAADDLLGSPVVAGTRS